MQLLIEEKDRVAIEYGGGATSGTRDNFLQRKKYKESVSIPGVMMLDTWYEKPNYGLLTKNYEPTILSTDELTFERFNKGGSSNLLPFGIYTSPTARCATFVVQAFNDFRNEYIERENTSLLSYPKFIESLIPAKGYVNFDSAYQLYISTLIEKVLPSLLEKVTGIENFDFYFDEIIESNISKFPITRSGFLLSNKCPINVSGLCVELASVSYSDDKSKGEMIASKDFQCYAELANEYGFYVDKNTPWRIIANLESEKMKEYISFTREDTSTEIILNKTFRTKTHYDDISSFYFFYNSILSRLKKLKPINLGRPMSELKAIEKTLKIRMIEVGCNMNNYQENLQTVLDLHNTYSVYYPSNTLKPASAKIGKICSEQLKNIYEKKESTSSNNTTTLKNYL